MSARTVYGRREKPSWEWQTAFIHRLRERMSQQGLTMEALSTRIGRSRCYVHKLVHHEYVPDLPTLIKLAEVLGVTLDWLLLGKEPHEPAR